MPQYKAPLRDMRFLLNEVFDYPAHYQRLPGAAEATPDTVDAILSACASFCEEVLAPLNQRGDEDGCVMRDGEVVTPRGFKEAYRQLVQGGWQGLCHPVEYGGQGLPMTLGMLKQELMGTANWAFSMYPGLSLGAMNTILAHGDEALKRTYLVPLTEGRWAGTMCLTEPQCGTDLGQVSTRAEPTADGAHLITGTKIFISSGDHDLAENIVHIVLARLPDAPAGTKGISLFIVPKYLPDGAFNQVSCGALEHKMGIKGSATCVINFDGAKGFLIGPVNKGLECMFTFMNTARIGTAIQGIGAAELAYQGALAYAKERRSMRAVSGKKEPDKVADALIHHGDVRRMLLTMKATAEGGRAMLYYAGQFADRMTAAIAQGDEAERVRCDDKLGFLTPILKGFLTELGCECADLGVQVFGGHGYIREHGMEQIVRDTRIATLYEGTTGIQALDLLGRKVLLLTKGRAVFDFTGTIFKLCARESRHSAMLPLVWQLGKYAAQWNYLTMRLMVGAAKDRDLVSASAFDFLKFSGYVMLGYFWALMAAKAHTQLGRPDAPETPDFYRAKIQTAAFYFDRLLPRARAHAEAALAPARSTMQLPAEHFAFG
jgi:alkylation response protein AidB-like acyl-CoA dehydrogenase